MNQAPKMPNCLPLIYSNTICHSPYVQYYKKCCTVQIKPAFFTRHQALIL